MPPLRRGVALSLLLERQPHRRSSSRALVVVLAVVTNVIFMPWGRVYCPG